MGKKATVGKLHLDSAFIIFVASLVLSTILRAYQMMNNVIDPSNGFYFQPINTTVAILNVILIISSVFMLIFPYLSSNIPKSVFPKSKSNHLAAAGLILTAGFGIDAISQVIDIFTARAAGYSSFGQFLSGSGMLPHIFQALFALLSAIYFFVFALSYLKGKNGYSSLKMLALSPTCWLISRMIIRFMRDTNYLKDSELLFEFVMLSFAMIFFFTFSRIGSGVGSKGKMWALFAAGLPAALFSLLCSIPRLIMYIIGRSDFVIQTSQLEYVDLAVGAFIILTLITIHSEYKAGKYEEYDEEDVYFNINPEITDFAFAAEVIPPQYQYPEYTQPSYSPEQGQASMKKNDEAFEIAAQYSNQYVRTDENAYVDKTEKQKASENDITENVYIDPLPDLDTDKK